ASLHDALPILQLGVAHAGNHAQAAIHEHIGIVVPAAGQEPVAAVTTFARARAAARVPLVGVGGGAELCGDVAAAAVECPLGADIDGAGGRVRILVGAGGLEDADRVDAGQRSLFEAEGARAARAGIGIGRSQADPVDGDAGVVGRQPAQAHVAHGAVASAVGIHARHELHELAGVAL